MPAGPRIRANNSFGITTDNPLTAGAVTFNSAGLATLPVVSSAHAVVVLDPKRVFGEPEIVVVTVHTAAATVATIIRGQYGTVARSHPQGTVWGHVPIDEDFIEVLTSATRPSNPYAHQIIAETDTAKFVTRSPDNTTWEDLTRRASGVWTDFTPVLTQGVNVTFTLTYSRFIRHGRHVVWNCHLNITGTGTAGQPIAITRPVAPFLGSNSAIGSGNFVDISANLNIGMIMLNATNDIRAIPTSTDQSQFLGAGAGVHGVALQNTDVFSFSVTYEAATQG